MAGNEEYTVNIVGESHYQSNIRRANEGEPIRLRLEPDNPHDKQAIAVEDCRGNTLGYIPRDSFLQEIIHDEERDCLAYIERVIGKEKEFLGIQLRIRIKTEGEGTSIYTGSVSQSRNRTKTIAEKAGRSIGKGIGGLIRSMFK